MCVSFNLQLFGSWYGSVASVVHVSDWRDGTSVAFKGPFKFDVRHPLGYAVFGYRSYDNGKKDVR